MRRPERLQKIYEYLKDNDKHLAGILNLDVDGKNFKKVKKSFHGHYDLLLKLHLEWPDLRFGQHLVTQGITPDLDGVFGREELRYLIDNKCFEPEELLLWGTYGKEGNEPIKYKFFNELDSEHIRNILYDGGIPNYHQIIFKKILIDRENK